MTKIRLVNEDHTFEKDVVLRLETLDASSIPNIPRIGEAVCVDTKDGPKKYRVHDIEYNIKSRGKDFPDVYVILR